MKAILIANPKGGSGNTTLSTNIAGYLASRGQHVAMLDLDRQQSAMLWLAQRDGELPMIWPLKGEKSHDKSADWLVIDSPAACIAPRSQARWRRWMTTVAVCWSATSSQTGKNS